MSAFRKMPNEKMSRGWRFLVWWFLIVFAAPLAYLKFFHRADAFEVRDIIEALLIAGIVVGSVMNYLFANHQKCPDCGCSMQAVYEDVHPKAADYHLLYCENCDVIWDTTIPTSKD